jgi:hypothetical protein
MPNRLTPREAAKIARDRGLSLSDARGLYGLADTTEVAEEIADLFVPSGPQRPRTEAAISA